MRVAIIDLGTNSVRFDVYSLADSGKVRLLHREKLMIRLGQGVFVKGRLDVAAVARTVAALEHFREIAEGLRVRKIVAFGTSALREATDASALVEEVKKSTGIEIKVISGKEEAKFIAQGILANQTPPKGRYALVDIGGGSTEISACRAAHVHKAASDSFPLGTARLQQVFLKRNPPRAANIKQMRDYIYNILSQKMRTERWPPCETVLGSSGTARALARILDKKKARGFSLKQLSQLVREMAEMSTTQLLEIEGMESKRVDMILAGAVLLEEICFALGARKILTTDFSLRDGIIYEEQRLAKSQKSSLLELHRDDLFIHASRFGENLDHLEHMAMLTGTLFERLRPVHGLAKRWEIYLLSTILLRNCGQAISYGDREKHAYYIVKHLDFPYMDGWEHELIARLCLLLQEGKDSGGTLDKRARAVFPKLLAMARVLDALDLGGRSLLKVRQVRITRSEVQLSFSGKATEGIEQLMVDRKKKLFESLFRRKLILRRL
jgi:exopolyphosphatase / guanosine-5'-triphosphate,3'-diphosphate pyrophosphatase